MHRATLYIIINLLTFIWAPCQKAEAAKIHIEFSGVFAQCPFYAPCAGTPLEQLLNTPFSGEVEFPDSGIDEAPANAEIGLFTFETIAFMTLVTEVTQFNLSMFSPVEILVGNCVGSSCAIHDDFVFISVSNNGYIFSLNLASPHPPFESDAIPAIDALIGLYASFDIYTPDFNHDINIDIANNPVVSPMIISITSVPLPFSGALFITPLLLTLVGFRLRRTARLE